ncbi:Radical SAM protein [Gammaproteobacteria bacterium]
MSESTPPLIDRAATILRPPQSVVMNTPRSVDLSLTGKCNLRCKTCFYADEMQSLRDMSTERWLVLMDELGTLGVMHANLSGGEPLARRDFPTILARLVANRLRFSMNSNGILFDAESARLLADTHRCDTVQVSMDGSCPEIHNLIRGPGAFEGAMRGIHHLLGAGLKISVRVTINRINVHDLPALFHLLFEEMGFSQVSTNEVFARGAGRCYVDELELNAEERVVARHHCLDAAARYPSLGAMAGPLVEARQLADIRAAMAGRSDWQRNGGGYLSACGSVFNKLAILHNGAVVPCTQLPHLVLGYVGQEPLGTLWRQAEALRYLRERRHIPLERLEGCRGCRYQCFCTGGCPAMAYAATGELTAVDPRGCYQRLLAEEVADVV